MITRSQKKKAVEELVSAEIETPLSGNGQNINPVAGTSKSPELHTENLEEMKSTVRSEMMSDLTKILAENQKGMLKLIAPVTKKQSALFVPEEIDSESGNVPTAATSTPIKTGNTVTYHKTAPVNSRNSSKCVGYACLCEEV